MKKLLFAILISLLSACATITKQPQIAPAAAKAPLQELRGIWITRFEYAHADPDTMRQRIVATMHRVADANFNAVFFQVRGQCETLYPSPLEPWSKLVGAKHPGIDPLKFAIAEARKHGLTFYAYVNLMPLWNEDAPPADSSHLYFRHGPGAPAESSWVCFEAPGKPMQRNEYFYLNPALPAVKTYLKQVIRHLVENYALDGLHFDRIRYAGDNYLSDTYSLAQFRADSVAAPLSRADWARQRLTDLVEDVVTEALLIKPYLQISAATWGMYRTEDLAVPGYERFGSGYGRYFQDAIGWLDRGIMDFIVPMIYWDIPDPKPNFNELWDDFQRRTPHWRNVIPGIIAKKEWFENGETARQISYARSHGARGTVLFSGRGLQRPGAMVTFRENLYTTKVPLPEPLKRNRPEQIVALRVDSLFSSGTFPQKVQFPEWGFRKTADANGWLGIILPKPPENLAMIAGETSLALDTRRWRTPYRYVAGETGDVTREWPWVEFRRIPGDTTTGASYPVLAKSEYPARAAINGDSLKMYRTGIFFNDVTFREGKNRLRASAFRADSSQALYEREIFYRPDTTTRQSFPLWIDPKSIRPAESQTLLAEDALRIEFRGSKGQRAFAEIRPEKLKIPLVRTDFADYSMYSGDLPLARLKPGKTQQITLLLAAEHPAHHGKKIAIPLDAAIKVQAEHDFPLVRTATDGAILSYNLGEIRLGGPIIAEYPKGVVLRVNGQVGDHYRVALNRNEWGFIAKNEVEILPPENLQPGYFLTSLSAAPADGRDVVSIPWLQPVPYAVFPEPEQQRIVIALYGVQTSSTWITHRRGLRIVKRLDWAQSTPETYRVIVHLKSPEIWGYTLKPSGKSLTLSVKYPPDLLQDSSGVSLQGLKIAIEAGHGGSNTGALGLSGLEEKAVNLDVAQRLAEICRANGMAVLQVRDSDTDMSLTAKRAAIEQSDAHLAVSIHANSAGGGYLRVAGTSTYYHNPFWAHFAETMYGKMLELPLKEFGAVGSFNYKVIRVYSRPAILVELAFMSHAEDEEKLADPAFRQQMAQKIFEGIADFVRASTKN